MSHTQRTKEENALKKYFATDFSCHVERIEKIVTLLKELNCSLGLLLTMAKQHLNRDECIELYNVAFFIQTMKEDELHSYNLVRTVDLNKYKIQAK